MWPLSTTALAAIRTFRTFTSTATFIDALSGAETSLPVKQSGSTVTVDVTAKNRRMLNLQLPPLQSLYDLMSVPGGEIVVTQTMRFIDHSTEPVPLGVFVVDQESLSYTPGGELQVTAPDRWARVQRNRFGLSRSSAASNLGWQEIKRLVEGAWPNSAYPFPGWSHLDTTAVTKVGSVVWDDGDREAAVLGLTATATLDLFFDATGLAVLQQLPVMSTETPSVWAVDASQSGVFLDGDRKLDLTTVRNAVIVSSSASDIILTPVEVKNTNAPIVDPLSTLGPLGYIPAYVNSPVVRTTAQALAVGNTRLQQQLQAAQQVSLTAVSNPALDGWDVIDVIYPPSEYGTSRAVEKQMIESVTIPLTPDGTQTITLRSTRAVTDDTS